MAERAGVEILVRPGGSREEVAGEHDGAVVIRLTAPPADGKANRALRKLVAERAGVPASAVEIARGAASRRKQVRVRGIGADELRAALLEGR